MWGLLKNKDPQFIGHGRGFLYLLEVGLFHFQSEITAVDPQGLKIYLDKKSQPFAAD